MANTTIYNPLIKKGFQEVADVSSIESDIAQLQSDVRTLQSNKVTKCFSNADLANLADGEIFTWHGATTSDPAELTQGYFYKKNASTINIVAGTQYFNYSGAQTLNINGYNFKPGDYYILEDNTPAEESNFYNIFLTNFTSNDDYYFIGNVFDLQPDSYLWQLSTLSFIKVTSFSYPNVTLENGDTLSVSSYSRARAQNLYSCISSDGNLVSIITTGFGLLIVHYTLNGNDFSLIDWFYPYPTSRGETIEDITINTYIFEQTDTQPKLENVANGAGGVLNINTDTNIAGNLTVSGTTSTVHAQEIQSEADYIELRNGNPLALANNERSGLEINNYDGNGTDCVLAVDNQGWARVGDKNGTLQKLATIEESPTDGAFATYNVTDKELQTTTDGSALTVKFTTEAVNGNIVSGETLAVMFKKIARVQNLTININTTKVSTSNITCIIVGNMVLINGSFTLSASENGVIIGTFDKRLAGMTFIASNSNTSCILGIIYSAENGCTLNGYSTQINVNYSFGGVTSLYIN